MTSETKAPTPKSVKNLIFRDDGTIVIQNVRASYPHLWEPYAGKNSDEKGKFGIVGLLPKETHREAIKALNEHIGTLCMAKWKKKLPSDARCLRDGAARAEDDDDMLNGMYTFNASDTRRPLVIDRSKTPLTEADDVIYPGCWVNIQVKLWEQDNKFGKKINANLLAVQFVRDDERFGDGAIGGDVDAFDELDEDDGDSGSADTDDFGD